MDDKPKIDFILENVARLPVQMMKLPVDVMVSSMETITKTMQEIQVQSHADYAAEDENGSGDPSAVRDLFRRNIMPLFGMFKLPSHVLASSFDTISRSVRSMKEPPEQDEIVQEGFDVVEFDRRIVPLTDEEAVLEKEAVVMGGRAGALTKTLWQIGRAGRSEFKRKWIAKFDYHVGSDIDPIDTPRIPHLITFEGGSKPAGSTDELNIHFALDRDYPDRELALIYDRWGGEKDFVHVDGELLSAVGGAGAGMHRHVELSLKGLCCGQHVISITCKGETLASEHRIDYLKLVDIGELEQSS